MQYAIGIMGLQIRSPFIMLTFPFLFRCDRFILKIFACLVRLLQFNSRFNTFIPDHKHYTPGSILKDCYTAMELILGIQHTINFVSMIQTCFTKLGTMC